MTDTDIDELFTNDAHNKRRTWRDRLTGQALADIERMETAMAKRGTPPNYVKVEAMLRAHGINITAQQIGAHYRNQGWRHNAPPPDHVEH